MSRKRLQLLLVLLILIAAFTPDAIRHLSPLLRFLLRGPGIHKEGYDLIGVGMSQRQVEALMGRLPGRYGVPDATGLVDQHSLGHPGRRDRFEMWWSDEGIIFVAFDEKDFVSGKGCMMDASYQRRPWFRAARQLRQPWFIDHIRREVVNRFGF